MEATATNGAAVQSYDDSDRQALQRLCHDLRQEIAVVQAVVEILMAEIDHSGPAKRWLDHLRDHSVRIAEMLRSVVESGGGRTQIDVSAVVTGIASDVQLRARTVIRVDAAPAPTMVDPLMLRRAVVNLLDNAVRAVGVRGAIEIRVRPTHDVVMIEVEDTGPGFGRGNPGLSALGLGIVRDFAAEHGGDLELTSGGLGGALARLTIPRRSPGQAELTERR
jgi:signal transduction histidine kinase